MKWPVLAVCLMMVSYLAHCAESTSRVSTTHDLRYLLPTNERLSSAFAENLVRTLTVDLISKNCEWIKVNNIRISKEIKFLPGLWIDADGHHF